MSTLDTAAQEHIKELQEQLEDCHVLIDLLQEQLAESELERTVLQEAVKRWRTTRRIEVA